MIGRKCVVLFGRCQESQDAVTLRKPEKDVILERCCDRKRDAVLERIKIKGL